MRRDGGTQMPPSYILPAYRHVDDLLAVAEQALVKAGDTARLFDGVIEVQSDQALKYVRGVREILEVRQGNV